MRIVTLNICHAKYSNIDEICNLILRINPDLLMVQEIDRNAERSGYIDQFNCICQQCEFSYSYFVPTILFENMGEYGIAVFSKTQIADIMSLNLSIYKDNEPRFAIAFRLKNYNVDFITAHLSRNELFAKIQLDYLKKYFCHSRWMFIGDFNLGTPTVETVLGYIDKDETFTWPYINPTVRLDHIITNFEHNGQSYIYDTYGKTDHLSVVLEINENIL